MRDTMAATTTTATITTSETHPAQPRACSSSSLSPQYRLPRAPSALFSGSAVQAEATASDNPLGDPVVEMMDGASLACLPRQKQKKQKMTMMIMMALTAA